MNTFRIILLIIILTNTLSIFAQEWKSLLKLDSSVQITSIAESYRFIWIGTSAGLYRINKGNSKHSHLTKKNSRLPHTYVTSIACNAEGQTYIGTKEGILLWDNYAYLPITTENSKLPENHITALAFDPIGDLWITTLDHGLYKGIGKDIKPFRLQ